MKMSLNQLDCWISGTPFGINIVGNLSSGGVTKKHKKWNQRGKSYDMLPDSLVHTSGDWQDSIITQKWGKAYDMLLDSLVNTFGDWQDSIITSEIDGITSFFHSLTLIQVDIYFLHRFPFNIGNIRNPIHVDIFFLLSLFLYCIPCLYFLVPCMKS